MAKVYDVEIEIVEQRGHSPNGHRAGAGAFCCPDHKNVTVYRLRGIERAR